MHIAPHRPCLTSSSEASCRPGHITVPTLQMRMPRLTALKAVQLVSGGARFGSRTVGVHSLCHCLMPSLPWGKMSDPGPDSQGRRQGRVRKEQILFGEIIGERNRKSPKWDCVWRSRHLPGIRTWDWEWAGLSQPPGRTTCHRDAHLPGKLRGCTSHLPIPLRGLWSARAALLATDTLASTVRLPAWLWPLGRKR